MIGYIKVKPANVRPEDLKFYTPRELWGMGYDTQSIAFIKMVKESAVYNDLASNWMRGLYG